MKKLSCILFAAAVLTAMGVSASANVGDIAGNLYTTDILTQVDGIDINGFSLDGKTMIALEDLRDYGFNIYYNNNVRTLFVTKTGTASSSFRPSVKRGTVGSVAGYYYETDIEAVFNGRYIKTYAIDGKLAAPVEDIAVFIDNFNKGTNVYDDESSFTYSTYSYDNSKRLLSMYTNISSYTNFNDMAEFKISSKSTPWTAARYPICHSSNYIFAPKMLGGLPHGGTAEYNTVICSNGLSYNAEAIADRYYVNIENPVMSPAGDKLYFKNGSAGDYKQLELNSMKISPLDPEEYINVSGNLINSDYKMILNGVTIPLYSIGGADYIRVEDMSECGFNVELKNSNTLSVTYNSNLKKASSVKSEKINKVARPLNDNITFKLNGVEINGENVYSDNEYHYIPVNVFAYDGEQSVYDTISYSYDVRSKTIRANSINVNEGEPEQNNTYSYYDYEYYTDENSDGYSKPYIELDGKNYRIEAYKNDSSVSIFMITDEDVVYSITNALYRYYGSDGDLYNNKKTALGLRNDILTITSGNRKIKFNTNTLTFTK